MSRRCSVGILEPCLAHTLSRGEQRMWPRGISLRAHPVADRPAVRRKRKVHRDGIWLWHPALRRSISAPATEEGAWLAPGLRVGDSGRRP